METFVHTPDGELKIDFNLPIVAPVIEKVKLEDESEIIEKYEPYCNDIRDNIGAWRYYRFRDAEHREHEIALLKRAILMFYKRVKYQGVTVRRDIRIGAHTLEGYVVDKSGRNKRWICNIQEGKWRTSKW